MQPGRHTFSRRSVRIGAIAVVILGALALGHERARAQLGLDTLRQVVDKAKGKQAVPGRDVLRRKAAPNLKRPLQKNPAVRDSVGNPTVRGKRGVERFTKDGLTKHRAKDLIGRDKFGKDRFGKDRNTADKLGGKGRLSKDQFKDKLGREKLSKDQLKDKLGREKASKDQLKDKLGKGKLGQDKLGGKDRLARDKLGKDKLGKDKLGKDKLGKNGVGKGQPGRDKLGRDQSAKDKLGKNKAGLAKIGKGKAIPDRRAVTRIGRAKNPVERSKIRVGHRREIITARLRLPPRPFPGAAGFTGVPPAGETRFVSTEMVFRVGPNVSRQTVDATASRLGLTVVGAQASSITGGTLYHFRLPPGRQVSQVVRSLESERVGIASPNYVYRITQDTASDTQGPPTGSPEQYTVEKLNLNEVHKVATGREVLVAVIDSKIDGKHPDLAGAIVDEYDAVGRTEQAHSHGTGMSGAIASHRKLLGIAPGARILAVHAFSTTTRQTPEATTRQIIAGIEWAINKGARIINMSFAGPYDPMLQLAMRNAAAKGVILVAASGNVGPKSPPLYPAADPHVIAVTATDESDSLFAQAVRGPHLAVAAPGVDVMVPAPAESYQLTTGTSVAAAHVSGVAALLLERHPAVDARTVLEVLTSTARNLNPKGRDDQYGWGLIDPAAALQELDSRIEDGRVIATRKPAAPKATGTSAAAKSAAPKGSKTAAPKTTAPSPASVGPPPSR
ncbi:MAG: S8 family serine peptidase [Rhizobiales bacterium]|nr:S8 family serine peptidase [Hyphomicrobiales bacterium]